MNEMGGYTMSKVVRDKPIVPPTNEEKQAVINRLRRIEGQVRGIQRMVEDERYCTDILIQMSAIQAALKKVGYTISERHVKHCLTEAVQSGEGEEVMEELLQVMQQISK